MHGNSKHWVSHQNTHKIDKGSEEPGGERGGGGGTVCIMSIPGTLLHMQCNAYYQKTTVANI